MLTDARAMHAIARAICHRLHRATHLPYYLRRIHYVVPVRVRFLWPFFNLRFYRRG